LHSTKLSYSMTKTILCREITLPKSEGDEENLEEEPEEENDEKEDKNERRRARTLMPSLCPYGPYTFELMKLPHVRSNLGLCPHMLNYVCICG